MQELNEDDLAKRERIRQAKIAELDGGGVPELHLTDLPKKKFVLK